MARTLTSGLLSRESGVRHGFAPQADGFPAWRPRQVHGAVLVEARGLSDAPGSTPADGALSRAGGPTVGIVTADCVPLLLAGGRGEVVAAVHAGWRGIAAGIVEAAVEGLAGIAPGRAVVAAIGPAAAGCCYEVGPEVIEAVRPAGERLLPTAEGRALLELRGLVFDRLVGAGIDRRSIELVGPCTICSREWPSYRREGDRAGRALAFVAPASGPRGPRGAGCSRTAPSP